MCTDCDQQLYNDLRIFKVVFWLIFYKSLMFRAKKNQTGNVDLSRLGTQIELTTRSLTRMFVDAKNFGGDLKYIKTFIEVAEDGDIQYRDKTGTIHNHTLFFQKIPSRGDSGYIIYACKRLVEEYVQVVIDSLHAKFLDMRVFNVTKIFNSISYPRELPLVYRNAHL